MKPAILVALLFRTLDAFRIFDSVSVISNGNNPRLQTVSILGYNQLLNRLNLGLGSAVSVLIFLIVILIAVVFIKALRAQPRPAARGELMAVAGGHRGRRIAGWSTPTSSSSCARCSPCSGC